MQLRALSILMLTSSLVVGCSGSISPTITSLSNLIDEQTSVVDKQVADAGLYPGVLESYARNSTKVINPDHVDDEALLDPVDGQFTGTVEDLVTQIAATIGYGTAAAGEKPGSPIIVVVMQYNLPAIGILREGFLQAKDRAHLVVDQTTKTLTIMYRRPVRSPVPYLEGQAI